MSVIRHAHDVATAFTRLNRSPEPALHCSRAAHSSPTPGEGSCRDLTDEDDGGLEAFRHSEQRPHHLFAVTDPARPPSRMTAEPGQFFLNRLFQFIK